MGAGGVLICYTVGQISVIDPAYNLYRVQLTTKCDNSSANGTENGLATLDNTTNPEVLVMGLHATGGGGPDFADVRNWFHLFVQ